MSDPSPETQGTEGTAVKAIIKNVDSGSFSTLLVVLEIILSELDSATSKKQVC